MLLKGKHIVGEMAEFYNDHCDPFEDDPVCRYCKNTNVEWEMTPAGWRLFNEDGSLHQCNDPFELVKKVERNGHRKIVRAAQKVPRQPR